MTSDSRVERIVSLRSWPISRSRLMLGAKAGVSSMIAWYAALLIPGADPYAYFAPFGAVIAMTFTIADSVRQCIRALVAIGLGGALALASDWLLPEAGIAVCLMVMFGVLLGGWRALGTMGQWIPFTALFVLIVGGANPEEYVASYAGLTLMGGAIATVVNIAVPPMPVSSFGPLENRIRYRLAQHFDGLAAWLREEAVASPAESFDERQVLAPLLVELWDATDWTADARRINPRARWHESRATRQYEEAARLEQLIYLGQQTGELVAEGMNGSRSQPCLDAEARRGVADALTELAQCLRWADGDLRARRDQVGVANRRLRDVDGLSPKDNDWLLTSIVVSIRRSLQVLMPAEFKA